MAENAATNTAANTQITDAVTQANVKVLGEAPAQALGNAYMALSHAVSIQMENAAQSQSRSKVLNAALLSSIAASLTGTQAQNETTGGQDNG